MSKKNRIEKNMLERVLEYVRRVSIKNAGAASIKGTFEPTVPEKLKNGNIRNARGGGIQQYVRVIQKHEKYMLLGFLSLLIGYILLYCSK